MANPEQNQLQTPEIPADPPVIDEGGAADIAAPEIIDPQPNQSEDAKEPTAPKPYVDEAREEIIARAREMRLKQVTPFNGDIRSPSVIYGNMVEQPEAAQPDQRPEPVTAQPAQAAVTPKPLNGIDPAFLQQKVPIIVDGERQEVSIEDLTRSFQIDRAADKRLAYAQALLQQTQEFHRQATPAQQPADNFDANRRDVQDQQTRQDDDNAILTDDLVEKIQLGSPQEARAALEQFVQAATRRTPAADDPRRILTAIEDHNSQQAVIAFAEKNQQIATNPAIQNAAAVHIHREMAKDLLAAGFSMDDLRTQAATPAALSALHKQARIDGVRGVRPVRELVDAGYQGAVTELRGLLTPAQQPGGANQPAAVEHRQQRKEALQQQPTARRLSPNMPQSQPSLSPEQSRGRAAAEILRSRGQHV